MKRVLVLSIIGLLLIPSVVLAQADDRYAGYPRSLVGWPETLPDLQACFNQEYYEPRDTHLMKYTNRVKIAGYRIQEADECVWMRTRNGDRYVLRPQGTKVAQDSQGRDLFDFGSPKGEACGNPRPFSYGQPGAMQAPAVDMPEQAPVNGPSLHRETERVVHREREETKIKRGSPWWKWPLIIGGGGAVGYLVYDYYNCPPGTRRVR